jgi:RHS repeat-associated protein
LTDNPTTAEEEAFYANPLRYRGYYYDQETGYYYLQSRYYDPSICRFINSDIPEIAQQSKDEEIGLNSFAYCASDPVNCIDPNGFNKTYSYSTKKAHKYAEKWYDDKNNLYPYFDGHDCTNFVSQCVHAGGYGMDYIWFSAVLKCSPAWSKVGNFAKWIVRDIVAKKYVIKSENEVTKFIKSIEDKSYCRYIIIFDFESDGTKDHTTISGKVFTNTNDMGFYAHSNSSDGKSNTLKKVIKRYKNKNKKVTIHIYKIKNSAKY